MQAQITGKECRFVVYAGTPSWDKPDLHLVKEKVYYADGTTKPAVNLIYDYQRPYWIAKKGVRNYKQHKEWLPVSSLIERKSSESKLLDNAAKALGMPWFRGSKRKLQENPYLFGTDINSTAVIKKAYQDRYKDTQESLFTILDLDIETDVIHGTGEIIMLSFYFNSLCYTVVKKSAIEGHHNVEEKVNAISDKYLSEYITKYNIKFELELADTEYDILRKTFAKIHELMPDFVAIWNMDFEISKFIEAAARAGTDLANVVCDPSVPKDYRKFEYIQGQSQKVTASGKITPIPPAARWHTVICPASFYFVDAMCSFKHVRIGRPERASYGLDAILNEELGLGKLRFEKADGYTGLTWHEVMQSQYMLEYIVYNRFDVIGMFLLEEKNKDMSLLLPLYSGTSDFRDFKSQPRRTADSLHWTALEKGLVIGTTSKAIKDEFVDKVYGMNGWISNLAASLITEQGLAIIKEDPLIRTNIYTNVADLDVASSYPYGEVCYNISKETTVREVVDIKGIDPQVYKIQNMLLTSGHVDSLQWCSIMLGFPTLEELDTKFDEDNHHGQQ